MHNIFFPVETIARELDCRILLAARIVKKGRRIYICNHQHLSKLLHHFQGGIYVGKHIFHQLMPKEDWTQYKKAKQHGIDVIYLPEEGAIYKGTPEDWKKVLALQYDPMGFDRNDRICVWGNWQRSVHGNQQLEVPVHTTGHPRFDLLKPTYRGIYKPQQERLTERFGDYILINSNYSWANYGLGIDHLFSGQLGYDSQNPAKRQAFVEFYAHTTKSMMDMICLVHRLATEFPEKNLIYRSHPSEADALYKTVFSGVKNIHVIHEGPIGPWLLAADTIIHEGCTTAIEASFSDAKIINYKATQDSENDIRLPNLVGHKATTPEEAIGIIRDNKPCSINPEALHELEEMMENYHSDSFENLARVIEEKIDSLSSSTFKSPKISTLHREYLRSSLSKKWKKAVSSKRRKSREYAEKKFPGFDPKMISSRIDLAAGIMGTKVKLAYADPMILVLESGE
ncbi:MAG: hypothetical protein JXR23_06630 [Pontiellaceae bacterium]|nr:hypothetical protein [Pontiellaceae bacterium]